MLSQAHRAETSCGATRAGPLQREQRSRTCVMRIRIWLCVRHVVKRNRETEETAAEQSKWPAHCDESLENTADADNPPERENRVIHASTFVSLMSLLGTCPCFPCASSGISQSSSSSNSQFNDPMKTRARESLSSLQSHRAQSPFKMIKKGEKKNSPHWGIASLVLVVVMPLC